jgi:hypothetical protein
MLLVLNPDSGGTAAVLLATTKTMLFEFQGRLYITTREEDSFIKWRAMLFN